MWRREQGCRECKTYHSYTSFVQYAGVPQFVWLSNSSISTIRYDILVVLSNKLFCYISKIYGMAD